MICLNPKYEHLRPWLEQLPRQFDSLGCVIYQQRNTIRQIEVEGLSLTVKRYCKPHLLNRIVYSTIRRPKGVRAYRNAERLTRLGIATPEPVAYIIPGTGLIGESYLVTLTSPLTHTMYDMRDGRTEGREQLLRELGRFTARMHSAGVLHLDYSPGNILYECTDGQYRFEIVDINRMRFGRVSEQQGCENFARLWGRRSAFHCLAEGYAAELGLDAEQCYSAMLRGRERFWRHRSTEHFTTDESFTVGVIVSTYNQPRMLRLCLEALACQSHRADEVIVADDGSTAETAEVIRQYADRLPIKHIRHEDRGFRKTAILNRAVVAATADYLIFIDQDLLARRDFISKHYKAARPGHYVSGGAVKISEQLSALITCRDIREGLIWRRDWITDHGMPWNRRMNKLSSNRLYCRVMNCITPTHATWNGGDSSTWREAIIRANGFDTRMRYGAEDREFGTRLRNAGFRGTQLRYGLALIHLYHDRPYVNDADWAENRRIWAETRSTRRTVTDHGIKQLLPQNQQ